MLNQALSSVTILLLTVSSLQVCQSLRNGTVSYRNGQIQIDGTVENFLAGEMHYFRVPKQQWHDRLTKMRQAGIRAVSTPIEWATHEPTEGAFVFNNDADIEHFITLAEQTGLYVILRCGPYIDADRNLGGLPQWLLFKKELQTSAWRSSTSEYAVYTERWLNALLSKLKPLLYANGGPIILIQIDNDSGEKCNLEFMEYLFNFFQNLLGSEVILFTKQEYSRVHLNCSLPNVPSALGVSGSDITDKLQELTIYLKENSPILIDFMIHSTTSPDFEAINSFWTTVLRQGFSINYYMFVGGTNFGFSVENFGYTTSYDNNAPISVTGEFSEQYYIVQKNLSSNSNKNFMDYMPSNKIIYPRIELEPFGHLFSKIVKSKLALPLVQKMRPVTFQEVQQGLGFILYETVIRRRAKRNSLLKLTKITDCGYIFFRRRFLGYSSSNDSNIFKLDRPDAGDVLQIFVENMGYPSKGFFSKRQLKGISGPVILNKHKILGWNVYRYPFENLKLLFETAFTLPRARFFGVGPRMYRGRFRGSVLNAFNQKDSFLSMESMGKGMVFLNRVNLGRYWASAKRQLTVYIPGCYVKPYPEVNEVIILELERTSPNCCKIINFGLAD